MQHCEASGAESINVALFLAHQLGMHVFNDTNDGEGRATAGQAQHQPMLAISHAQALYNTPYQPLERFTQHQQQPPASSARQNLMYSHTPTSLPTHHPTSLPLPNDTTIHATPRNSDISSCVSRHGSSSSSWGLSSSCNGSRGNGSSSGHRFDPYRQLHPPGCAGYPGTGAYPTADAATSSPSSGITANGLPGNQIYNSMGLQQHIPAGPYAGPHFGTTPGGGRAFSGSGGRYGGRSGARSDGPGFRYSGGRCGVGGRGAHRAPARGPPVSAGARGPVPWVKQGCWLLPRQFSARAGAGAHHAAVGQQMAADAAAGGANMMLSAADIGVDTSSLPDSSSSSSQIAAKVVVIMRGLPGSGKSTRSAQIAAEAKQAASAAAAADSGAVVAIHSTDSFFVNAAGHYHFEPALLSLNHQRNLDAFNASLAAGVGTVIVDNTNLQPWQYERYVRAAWAAGYRVKEEVMGEFTEAAAAEYATRNIHGVSYEKLLVMLDQWRQQN